MTILSRSHGEGSSGVVSSISIVMAIGLMFYFIILPGLKINLVSSTVPFGSSNFGPSPNIRMKDSTLQQSAGDWVTINGVQYTIWDYRTPEQGGLSLLKGQVVTISSTGAIVSDLNIASRVISVRWLIVASAQVLQAYSSLQGTIAVASQMTAAVRGLLSGNNIHLPADVSSALTDLRGAVATGSDKLAPVANAVTLSVGAANSLSKSHSDTDAEAFLDSFAVGSVPEARLALVLFAVQGVEQLQVPIGSWLSSVTSSITQTTPSINAIQSTYGEAEVSATLVA